MYTYTCVYIIGLESHPPCYWRIFDTDYMDVRLLKHTMFPARFANLFDTRGGMTSLSREWYIPHVFETFYQNAIPNHLGSCAQFEFWHCFRSLACTKHVDLQVLQFGLLCRPVWLRRSKLGLLRRPRSSPQPPWRPRVQLASGWQSAMCASTRAMGEPLAVAHSGTSPQNY